MRILDLYSGAGGLLLGFARVFPSAKFDHYENNKHAIATLNRNGYPCEETDIQTVKRFPKADMVIGGPPCQAFSTFNTTKKPNDPKREAWRPMMRAVHDSECRAFVMENVPALFSKVQFQDILGIGKNLGYTVKHAFLCAAHFGGATTRRRLFIVGFKGDRAWSPPLPTHAEHPGMFGLKKWVTIRDRIGDLPDPPPDRLLVCSKHDRTGAALVPMDAIPLHWLREHQPQFISPTYRTRDTTFFPRAYGSFEWDKPARTLTTKFWQHVKGQMHPGRKRAFTLREAARLHGFPDTWEFAGTKYKVATQIGNAVPVELSEAVARSVKDSERGAAR